MAIYIGGKKVQETGGKYKAKGVKEPSRNVIKKKTALQVPDARDRQKANQAYQDKSD